MNVVKETELGEDPEQGGTIHIGLSRISDLQEAQKVSSGNMGGAAEGGAFDPAVISLLASSYVLGDCGVPGSESKAQNIKWAVDALQRNNRIALDAGLDGHASILSSVATLITLLNRSPALNRQSIPLGGNAILTSDVAVEDPFRKLALSSLRDLLSEMLDAGDCQHFVICFEILRRNDLLVGICELPKPSPVAEANLALPANERKSGGDSSSKIISPPLQPQPRLLSTVRVREAYLAYIDVLSRLGLFTAANDLIKTSEDPYISELSKKGIRLKVGCAKCGKEVSADQVSGGAQGVTAITAIYCGKCHRSAGRCMLCHTPVLGLFRWCQICSHGGHKACIEQWLFRQIECSKVIDDNFRGGPRIWRKMTRCQVVETNNNSSKKNNSQISSNSISCPSGCGHHCFLVSAPNPLP